MYRTWRKIVQIGLVIVLLAGCVPFSSVSAPPINSVSQSSDPSPVQVAPAQAQPEPISFASEPFPISGPLTTDVPARPMPNPLDSAYVKDVELGDGRHQAIVSQTPINYQAADGSWQPIDPRFESVSNGFVNRTNLLKISAGDRQAVLRVQNGKSLVGWEPQAVVWTQPSEGDSEIVLAKPVSADQSSDGTLANNGRTIRYSQNWTLPGLVEEITSGPGQVEQSLVFASPSLPVRERGGGEGENYLTLLATLHLLPGQTLYAEGKTQTAAFTTAGSVHIRDAQGQTVLVFSPARAFEQAHPNVSVQGHYRLTPQKEGEWQIAVDTPWSWWVEAARNYPVVLDPTMYVLQPVDAVKVYSGAFCAWDLPSGDPEVDCIAVGRRPECGNGQDITRSLIRFNNLPTLPPNYLIEKAQLLITPIRGYYAPIANTGKTFPASADIEVRRVTTNWDPGTVSWSNYQVDPTPIDGAHAASVMPPWAYLDSGSPRLDLGTLWTLQTGNTGLVRDWLNGQPNYGLELREATDSTCSGTACYNFVEIPHPATWTSSDKNLVDFWLSGEGEGMISDGGGMMLLLTYTPPTLANNVPYSYVNRPVLPTGGDNYLMTYHTYNLPASTSAWTAVGVRGLQVVSDGLKLYAASNLGLSVTCGDNVFCAETPSPANDDSNYVMIHGDPSADHYKARVQAPTSTDPNRDTYIIEASTSITLPGFTPWPDITEPGTGIMTYTFDMSSTHVLRAFALNLITDTRVMVDMSVSGSASARLFHPTNDNLYTYAKDESINPLGQKITVSAADAGSWGLIVEYQDDVTPDRPPSTSPINVHVEIVVRSCPLDAIPTKDGCQFMKKPHPADYDYPGQPATPRVAIGSFIIYSEAGFYENSPFPGDYTTRKRAANNKLYAPLIGWGTNSGRYIVVANGDIVFNPTALTLEGLSQPNVWLGKDPPGAIDPVLELWTGNFDGYPGSGQTNYGYLVPKGLTYANYAGLPLSFDDALSMVFKVNVRQNDATQSPLQQAEGRATLTRAVEVSPGVTQNFTFQLDWTVRAEGYNDPSFTSTLARLGGPTQAEVGSLSLKFGDTWSIDYDHSVNLPNGRFWLLRNSSTGGTPAKIVQPDALGSAWKPVQAVIYPPGYGPPTFDGSQMVCLGACLDLRHATLDSPGVENREWEMPDTLITGNAATVMVSQPGNLTVFSADHPNAPADVSVPFSFRTFEGKVKVDKVPCPGSGNPNAVIVVTGDTAIALPGLGSDTNPSQMISATFTLCQSKLREVTLSFKTSPGIPVGNTGIMVDMVSGSVTLGPGYTQISMSIHYYSGPGLIDGTATVTINTEGLFDMQAEGAVVAMVGYSGHAWVSWNPLDMGVDVNAWYGGWLSGQVYAHLWQGQGWQHKYWWLPDNDEKHFAGSIDAEVTIHEGQAFSWWWIDIPPWDVSFGIWVAFGQFCANDSCTAYEWGVKGGFSVVGYDVGLYYGFDSGFDFILGSDDHILIDQYGGLSALDADVEAQDRRPSPVPLIGGKPASLKILSVANPAASVYTQPLTVTANTGSFLAAMGWEHGSPELSLIRPDGIEISRTNAASYGVGVTTTKGISNSILYGVKNPMAGIWQAKVSNATPEDYYHVVYFANKKAPAVALTQPATNQVFATNNISYTIQWTASADSPLNISLYYSVTETSVLTPSQKPGGVIVEHLPITATQFQWDMSYLATGRYHIYAEVSEPQLARPASGYLTQTRPYSLSSQLPGLIRLSAPGTISITDQVAPTIPMTPTLTDLHDAVMACWEPNHDHDLAGYVLLYWFRDWQGNWHGHPLRVNATVPYPPRPDKTLECVRIGGLNAGSEVEVKTRSYDASGNMSAYQAGYVTRTLSVIASDPVASTAPLTGTVGISHSVALTWTGVLPLCLPPWDHCGTYRVYYAREAPAGPGQPGTGATEGSSPIIRRNLLWGNQITIHGLAPGYVYHFAVQAMDADGRSGPLSNDLQLLLTDGVDLNLNGLPDDWEIAHGITDPNADSDGDGLTDLEEFRLGTDPNRPDTDFDGWSDGEEHVAGSNPGDRQSISLTAIISGVIPLPRLDLSTNHLTFRTYEGGPAPNFQRVTASNTGGGVLTATFTSGVSWLWMLSCFTVPHGVIPNCRMIGVNRSQLRRGHYTGVITVTGAAGSRTQDSPQQIAVDLWVAQGYPPGYKMYLYLPVVMRH